MVVLQIETGIGSSRWRSRSSDGAAHIAISRKRQNPVGWNYSTGNCDGVDPDFAFCRGFGGAICGAVREVGSGLFAVCSHIQWAGWIPLWGTEKGRFFGAGSPEGITTMKTAVQYPAATAGVSLVSSEATSCAFPPCSVHGVLFRTSMRMAILHTCGNGKCNTGGCGFPYGY